VSELYSAVVPPTQANLAAITIRVRVAHEAVDNAAQDMLAHAMAAGDALIEAHQEIPHGKWEAWLRDDCDLSVRTAGRYIQLAKARPIIDAANRSRTTDLTIAGALRLLGNSQKSKPDKKPKVSAGLSLREWNAADLEKRRNFLSEIGLVSFFEAMPPVWRGEIERRVFGQRAAAAAPATPLSDKIIKSLLQALSTTAPGESIAALEAIRRLLKSNGHDIHNLAISIQGTTKKRAA
jgi:Protein of unknown function (DUF3102)